MQPLVVLIVTVAIWSFFFFYLAFYYDMLLNSILSDFFIKVWYVNLEVIPAAKMCQY